MAGAMLHSNYGLDSMKTLLEDGDKAQIEKSVTEFMGTLTVKKRKKMAQWRNFNQKKATFDSWKTKLKTILFMESEGNVNNKLSTRGVYAKTSTKSYWPHHHHGSLR